MKLNWRIWDIDKATFQFYHNFYELFSTQCNKYDIIDFSVEKYFFHERFFILTHFQTSFYS